MNEQNPTNEHPYYDADCPKCGKRTAWLDLRENGDVVRCIHCGYEIELNLTVADTLWQRCFWEEYNHCKSQGKEAVVFADVDARVQQIAKLDISKLLEFIGQTELSIERQNIRIDVRCVGDGSMDAGCGHRGGVGGQTCPKCGGMLLSQEGRNAAARLQRQWDREASEEISHG